VQLTIVDYGLGNLASVARAFRFLGAAAEITSDPDKIVAAQRLVLPGVGSFGTAMMNLEDRGLVVPLKTFARAGRPLLGLCLGMQLLLDESVEGGRHEGLGLVSGVVRRLDAAPQSGCKVPHIGWSDVQPAADSWDGTHLQGMAAGEALYFVHSYYVLPTQRSEVLAWTEYGGTRFCSALHKDNLFACQAHPEKSAEAGLKILANFLRMPS
jgi:imidazole glycerol-phosphate synthase subunit HisH